MFIIEFIRNGVGDYVEIQEEDLYKMVNLFTAHFITGEVSYFRVFRP